MFQISKPNPIHPFSFVCPFPWNTQPTVMQPLDTQSFFFSSLLDDFMLLLCASLQRQVFDDENKAAVRLMAGDNVEICRDLDAASFSVHNPVPDFIHCRCGGSLSNHFSILPCSSQNQERAVLSIFGVLSSGVCVVCLCTYIYIYRCVLEYFDFDDLLIKYQSFFDSCLFSLFNRTTFLKSVIITVLP